MIGQLQLMKEIKVLLNMKAMNLKVMLKFTLFIYLQNACSTPLTQSMQKLLELSQAKCGITMT